MKIALFMTAVYVSFSIFCPYGDAVRSASVSQRERLNNTYAVNIVGNSQSDDNRIIQTATGANGFSTYDNFAEAYFENLTVNFGYNTFNSCGYIALAMLLSYYDTVISDNIVPEAYDCISVGTGTNTILRNNSPGSWDYDFTGRDCLDEYVGVGKKIDEATSYDYFRFIGDMQDVSLQARLIYLGEQAFGMYNYDNDYPNFCVTHLDDLASLLVLYLQSESGLNRITNEFTVYWTESSGESVRSKIVEKVKQGKPVLTFVKQNGQPLGHCCIAYSYDEATDKVYFHSGWENYSTKSDLASMQFDTYLGYIYTEFNINHSHSNNYAVEQADGTYKYYCYCSDEIVTYKHDKCSYSHYKNVTSTQHTAYCICEDERVENHSYTNRYVKKSALMHTAYCACGSSKLSAHTWTSGGTINGKKYLRCIGCGYTKEDDGDTPIIMKKGNLQNLIDVVESDFEVETASLVS